MKALLPVCFMLWAVVTLTTNPACRTNSRPAVSPAMNEMASEQDHIQWVSDSIRMVNDSMITQAHEMIQTGDLILRTGTDFSSDQVKRLSKKDRTYSHGGIAVIDSGEVFVYHVEPDYHLLNDKVRKEKLDSFCDPARNLGFAIARYNLSNDQQKTFISWLDRQYRMEVPFDVQFDLHTDNRLYCSEMIAKGLARATDNNMVITTERITDKSKYKLIKQYFRLTEKEIRARDLILIDHLYLNPHCTVLKQYKYLSNP
jgi:hypothetical protein